MNSNEINDLTFKSDRLLEVEPEHRADAYEAGESRRRLRKNAALAVENVDDPPRGRAQRQRERVGGYFSAFELAPSAPPSCDKNDEDAYREARPRGRDEFCPTGQRTGAVTKAEPDPFAALCASIIDVGNSAGNRRALVEIADSANPVITVRHN